MQNVLKFFIFCLGVGGFIYPKATMADLFSCERIMAKTRLTFEMQGENTIILSSQNKEEPIFLTNIKAPQCDILAPDLWLITDGTVEFNSINARFVHNYGNLKAENIILSAQLEDLSQDDKKDESPADTEETPSEKTPPFCGLDNGYSDTGLNQVEATYIDVQCPDDVAIHNLGGTIKATEIRAQSYSPRMLKEGWGSVGISNQAFEDKEATITAKVIKGRGYSEGIYNSPDSSIYARTIEGIGIDSSPDEDPDNLFHGNGIENFGKIETQEAKCCPAHDGECYINSGVQIDDQEPEGWISAEVQDICAQ